MMAGSVLELVGWLQGGVEVKMSGDYRVGVSEVKKEGCVGSMDEVGGETRALEGKREGELAPFSEVGKKLRSLLTSSPSERKKKASRRGKPTEVAIQLHLFDRTTTTCTRGEAETPWSFSRRERRRWLPFSLQQQREPQKKK